MVPGKVEKVKEPLHGYCNSEVNVVLLSELRKWMEESCNVTLGCRIMYKTDAELTVTLDSTSKRST